MSQVSWKARAEWTYLQKQARSSRLILGWAATAALVPMMARAMTLKNCANVSAVWEYGAGR